MKKKKKKERKEKEKKKENEAAKMKKKNGFYKNTYRYRFISLKVLTHLKEKLQFVQAENQVQKANLKVLESTVANKRDILSRTKQGRLQRRRTDWSLRGWKNGIRRFPCLFCKNLSPQSSLSWYPYRTISGLVLLPLFHSFSLPHFLRIHFLPSTHYNAARDALRIDNQKLRQNCGMLGNEALLRDFEQRKDESDLLEQKLER